MRNRWWAVPVLVGAAAVLTACGSSSPPASSPATSAPAASSSPSPASPSSTTVTISTRSTSIGTILVNAQGHTLYWFAIDTPAKSNCNGTCAGYWPPVIGMPVAASGTTLPKGFGTITRSNGSTQATYDGHPLYTYAADTSAGMTSGNGLDASGGLWWAMTPSGAKPAGSGGASPTAGTSTSTGGGYGY
jgi:predicted lipoprotein with Yx(FWY)xxD motif